MEPLKLATHAFQKEKEPFSLENDVEEKASKISGLSPRNIISVIGSRFFNSESQESTDVGQAPSNNVINNNKKQAPSKEKSKKEEISEKSSGVSKNVKNGKKFFLRLKPKDYQQKPGKPIDRDLRRFRAKYNSSMGSIIRDWLSLIYCILILRMNLISFLINNLEYGTDEEIQLHKQVLLESKIMFNMIRSAQNSSQEKFLTLWLQLEKLISNRKIFKNALQMLQMKELAPKDWKAAEEKLTDLHNQFESATEQVKEIQKSKVDTEILTTETILNLESLVNSKESECQQLVEKITELKKREVQMRGRILINMKSYKDLKAKKQQLMKIEEKMGKLKSDQVALALEYSSKIYDLRNELEELEKQIKDEKDQKKKIKTLLEGFGDYVEKQPVAIKTEQ